MATRTGKPPIRIPWGRIAAWVVGVPLVAVVVAALGAAMLRANPAWFVAIADRHMPRTPALAISDAPEDDAVFFKYGAIGNEAADGIPTKIWSILPDVCPSLLPRGGGAGYANFGFTYETDPETRRPRPTPIGFSRTRLGLAPFDVEVMAINCATCHVQTYRVPGEQQTRIFVGGASNRLDAQGYTRFLAACAETPGFDTGAIMTAIGRRFPDTALPERLMLRYLVVPVTRSLIRERIGARFHWTWSRPPWGPGRVSPFNPVKFDYLRQPLDETIDHSDVMPAWNAAAKQRLRTPTLWHWDGLSADLREVIVNSALGDGVTRFGYRDATIDRLYRYLDGLRAPKAPVRIDRDLRERGAALFQSACADCHAPSGRRVMTIIPRREIGTDPGRLEMWTPEAAAAYNAYDGEDKDPALPWTFRQFRKHDGYLAQPLDGIWLTGPYLHNGSVPTLDDLLKPPSERPKAFLRGLDELDFAKGGYKAPPCVPGRPAEAAGFCYDTALPGNANTGHEYGTTLTPEERAALLHYLLTL